MRLAPWNAAALVAGVLVLAAGGPWLWSHLRALPDAEALRARSGQRIVTLEVRGMTCDGCAAPVRAALAGVDGVAAAAVRRRQDRAYVVCEAGTGDSALVGAIRAIGPGFTARIVAR